jgi:predicted membrane protein
MNGSRTVTARLFIGLVVLTLGVLWTLDNLGMTDASEIVRWWPLVAIAWGLLHLFGIGVRPRVNIGALWTIIGVLALLGTLGVIHFTIFALWPLFLVLIGGSLVLRGWRGTSWIQSGTSHSSQPNVTAILSGAQHKIVGQDFQGADVTAVLAGVTMDFRSAHMVGRDATVDVFAMWGGIDLVVPEGWRVEGRVTPILGAYQDSTVVPADPNAPKLIVRGDVVMGGIEVMNEERLRKRVEHAFTDPETGEPVGAHVFPGGIVMGGVRVEKKRRGKRGVYGVTIGPGGIVVKSGYGEDPRGPAPNDAPDPRGPRSADSPRPSEPPHPSEPPRPSEPPQSQG